LQVRTLLSAPTKKFLCGDGGILADALPKEAKLSNLNYSKKLKNTV
jgi:hypothetical protein